MIEDIKKIKADVLRFMEQEVNKYGNGRMDTKQVGDLADVVKDLAMAEYYCTTAETMSGQSQMGYSQPMDRMGYGSGGSGGGMGGGRSGYGSGSMGHTDPMQVIRDMLATANPEMRAKIRTEIMGM